MLEWKIRMDLIQYAGRGCPPLSLDNITSYTPKAKPEQKPLGMLIPHQLHSQIRFAIVTPLPLFKN